MQLVHKSSGTRLPRIFSGVELHATIKTLAICAFALNFAGLGLARSKHHRKSARLLRQVDMQSNTTTIVKAENNHQYKLPEGCYGQKQLRDLLTLNTSRIKYQPEPPEWCSNTGAMVPKYLAATPAQHTSPPYEINVYEFQKSDAFRIVLKSIDSNSNIKEALMAAQVVDLNGTLPTYIGRFLPSKGVNLVCCNLMDKNVAWFKTTDDGVKQVVFYWVPYEVIADDHEGDFIFISTVARNPSEYWAKISSGKHHFTPPVTN